MNKESKTISLLATLSLAAFSNACGTESLSQVSDQTTPESPVQISDSPEVVKFFEILAEIASLGPSLAAFETNQSFDLDPEERNCETADKARVQEVYSSLVDKVFDGGIGSTEGWEGEIAAGLQALENWTPNAEYIVCGAGRAEYRAYYSDTYIVSDELRLMLSLGYED